MAKTVIKKRKRPQQTQTAEAPAAAEADATKTAETMPAAAVPAAAPAQINAAAPSGKGPRYGPFAILMLIATLCFIGLVIFQWVEWRYYHEPPTAFLSPQGMSAPSP